MAVQRTTNGFVTSVCDTESSYELALANKLSKTNDITQQNNTKEGTDEQH